MSPDNRLLGIIQTLFPVFKPNAMLGVGLLDSQSLNSLGILLNGRNPGNSFHTILAIDANKKIVYAELLPEPVLEQVQSETGNRREVLKNAAIVYLLGTQ